MNILLTSAGRRSYLVEYFKQALNGTGEVHVANSSSETPVVNLADKFVITPLIYSENYIPFLLDYCKKNKIQLLISLFDIDLPILSRNKKEFEKNGVTVVVSDEMVTDICNDKFKTYEFLLQNNLEAPKTFNSLEATKKAIKKEDIKFPLIVKPRWGMGSIGIFEAENEKELEIFYTKVINSIKRSYLSYESSQNIEASVIIQEKILGDEYNLDIINDLNGTYQNCIVKKKKAMRAGETDSAVIVNKPNIKKIGEILSNKLKHIGNMDVDVFVTKDKVYILEMNARFGGGYPFSHLAGVNLPLALIKWAKKESFDTRILMEEYGVIGHKDISIIKIPYNSYDIKEINMPKDIKKILISFSELFRPSILSRIGDLDEYATKLHKNATILVAENAETLGFVAFYANDYVNKTGYINFIAVNSKYRGKQIGQSLLNKCMTKARKLGMHSLKLEVRKDNDEAISFYKKNGFEYLEDLNEKSIYMMVDLV